MKASCVISPARLGGVAGDSVSGAVDTLMVPVHQLTERLLITPPAARDQVLLRVI
jgi:hypothetical protein